MTTKSEIARRDFLKLLGAAVAAVAVAPADLRVTIVGAPAYDDAPLVRRWMVREVSTLVERAGVPRRANHRAELTGVWVCASKESDRVLREADLLDWDVEHEVVVPVMTLNGVFMHETGRSTAEITLADAAWGVLMPGMIVEFRA